MTSVGSLLWIVALGAFFFFMMRKGGGCCGGGHDRNRDYESNMKELGDHTHSNDKDKPRGGCCG